MANVTEHSENNVTHRGRVLSWTGDKYGENYAWLTRVLHGCVLSHVWLFATAWTGAHQAPLSMGFSRQEYWSGLPYPSPGDLPNPGIESMSPMSPAMQVDSSPLSHQFF